MQVNIKFWKTKKFIKAVTLVQLLMLGAIGFEIIGLEIPMVRQVIGIIYLTVIPGIIILRLLRLYNLNIIEFILYAVGASVSFLMFSGFLINMIYPVIGIPNPLSESNVIISISLFISTMLILLNRFDTYNQDIDYTVENIKTHAIYLLTLVSILLTSILGTIYINSYGDNSILLIVVILLIILLVMLAYFDTSIIRKSYPITIFLISLSVIYSISLISKYLAGYDIQTEYYFYRLVDTNSVWESYVENINERFLNMNAMLSITILPVVYNRFLNMSGIEIFKIIFPFIFSFSFVGLYYIYAKQIGCKKAFFSITLIVFLIYFMSFETISLARQMIAQLFFVLLMVLMLNNDIPTMKKYILFVIFASSLIVSHYGLSYIYIFMLLSIFFIRHTFDIRYSSFFNKKMILYYVIFALSWYMFFSHSSTFNTIIKIGDHVLTSIETDFLSLGARENSALKVIGLQETVVRSLGREIHRLIQVVIQLLIIIGSVSTLIKDRHNHNKDYILFIPMSLAIILASIVLPNFSRDTMNMSRLYQVTLLILSPFFIIGGEILIVKMSNMFKTTNSKYIHDHLALKMLVLFILIPYLAFNSGLIYEITKDEPIPNVIGIQRIKTEGNNISKSSLYEAYITEQDIEGAIWLSDHRYVDKNIFAARKGTNIFRAYTKSVENVLIENRLIANNTIFRKNDYVYLRYINVQENIFNYPAAMGGLSTMDTRDVIYKIPRQKNRIYDNGGSQTLLLS